MIQIVFAQDGNADEIILDEGEEQQQEVQQQNNDDDSNDKYNTLQNDIGQDYSSQINGCPEILPETSTYTSQDGCQYPCPPISSDQVNVPQDCPIEPFTSSFSDEGKQSQPPEQQIQQTPQDATTTPSQKTFVSPTTGQALADNRLKTERSIPGKSFDPAGPVKPGQGNPERKGSILDSKPSEQGTGSPGESPTEREGIRGKAYLTVISKFLGVPESLKYVNISMGTTRGLADPPNIIGSETGVTFTLPALSHTGYILGHDAQLKIIDNLTCFLYVYSNESKTCTITFIHENLEEQLKNKR